MRVLNRGSLREPHDSATPVLCSTADLQPARSSTLQRCSMFEFARKLTRVLYNAVCPSTYALNTTRSWVAVALKVQPHGPHGCHWPEPFCRNQAFHQSGRGARIIARADDADPSGTLARRSPRPLGPSWAAVPLPLADAGFVLVLVHALPPKSLPGLHWRQSEWALRTRRRPAAVHLLNIKQQVPASPKPFFFFTPLGSFSLDEYL